jgi:hypothetical protein
MAESAQQSEVATDEGRRSAARHADTAQSVQDQVRQSQRNPALQPLDPKPLRHVHHGQTGAMWVAVGILFIGFVVGAIAVVLGPNWWLFAIGAGLCVIGLAVGKVMQILGFGIYQKK